MIVCPSCRHANDEEAATCAQCGASLEPGPTLLLGRRQQSQRPPIDVRAPRPPSPWRAVVALAVLVALGVGVALWYVLRPDPCKGTNFTSTRFGYCLTVPETWQASSARFGDGVTVDQFSPPSQAATVLVEAADLPDAADVGSFADAVRQKEEDAQLSPGPIEQTSLDGAPALAWTVDYSSSSGDYGMREVVVVHEHFGWRLVLNDVASDFDRDVTHFNTMLRSFRFT